MDVSQKAILRGGLLVFLGAVCLDERSGERGDGFVLRSTCLGRVVGGFGGAEFVVRWLEGPADDFFVQDVDDAEDGLVETSAHFVVGEHVQLVRVLEELEVGFEVVGAFGQVERDAVALFPQSGLL
ncbi:hypothetical protein ACXET9_06180 [Brachybacterium sp. DNPG3]